MTHPISAHLVVETEPDPEEVRLLDERIYEFNVQATGIADGELLASFLRDANGTAIGGVSGWTWGETCYVRHLFVPADLRNRGHGSSLMNVVECEARARGCRQIVLETHDFQAPQFYRRLGFKIAARVPEYPRGHESLILVKRLTAE